MSFNDSLLNTKLKKARSSFYFRDIRKSKKRKAINAFERNYSFSFNFKKDFKDKPVNEKLNELIRLSGVKIRGNKQPYDKRRAKKHFTKKKCFVCKEKAYFQHHIILLINGGYDSGVNRIPICCICHEIIHPWLQVSRMNDDLDKEFERIVELSYT